MKDNEPNIVPFSLHQHHKVPHFKETPSTKWVLYGEDNKYPQYLVNLFSRSGTHNALITGKVNYMCGQGLLVEMGKARLQDVISINAFLEKENSVGDTWNGVFRKISTDYELFNGFALQVIYNRMGKISEVAHIDFSRLRTNTTLNTFYYSPEFSKEYRAKDVRTMPAFDPSGSTYRDAKGKKSNIPLGGSAILYYREYRPGMGVYPLPDYMGCIVSIETDIEIANFHLNNAKNQFWGGKMISFTNGIPTEEAQAEIERRIKLKFAGTDNGGRFILNFADDKDKAPIITDLAATNTDKLFAQLRDDVTQQLFTGHKITSPILFSIQTPGALGQREEMRDAYEIFIVNYIKPRIKAPLYVVNTLCQLMMGDRGADITVKPLEQPQIELSENGILTLMDREEARRNLLKGYDLNQTPGTPANAVRVDPSVNPTNN